MAATTHFFGAARWGSGSPASWTRALGWHLISGSRDMRQPGEAQHGNSGSEHQATEQQKVGPEIVLGLSSAPLVSQKCCLSSTTMFLVLLTIHSCPSGSSSFFFSPSRRGLWPYPSSLCECVHADISIPGSDFV
mmetsp:Transcript_13285/g.29443  ORF Transcript_13285/g.29443 Transcript_13285/m.29443 type:complete len:134 (+) Transcript_13285:121-522(+)